METRHSGGYARGRTRYQLLIDHLAARSEAEIILTFPEIEIIVGSPLTPTAHVNPDVWSAASHRYVRHWRTLGWSARLDRHNRRVIFTHEEE